MRPACTALVLLGAIAAAPGSDAATFTVNDGVAIADAAPGDGICATGARRCTFLAALQETEALAGADEILLDGTTATLPGPAELTIRDTLRVVGPGTLTQATPGPGPALGVRDLGQLTLVDLHASNVGLRAVASLTLTGCVFENDVLVSAIRVEPGGDLHVSTTTITMSSLSNGTNYILVEGGRATLDGVFATAWTRLDHALPSGFLRVTSGELDVTGLDLILTGLNGIEVTGGSASIERSALAWSHDVTGRADTGWLASVTGGSLSLESCVLDGHLGRGLEAEGAGFDLGASGSATLSHCAIRNLNGYGVRSAGTLVVHDSVISGTTAAWQGGIETRGGTGLTVTDGVARVERTKVMENVVSSSGTAGTVPSHGGGMDLTGGSLEVIDSEVSANEVSSGFYSEIATGGGVSMEGGMLRIERSLIAGNSALGAGGGLAILGGSCEILSSTISGCTATGWAPGTGDGGGGGAWVRGGTLRLRSTTVAHNSSASGRSVAVGGVVSINVPPLWPSHLFASGSLLADNGVDWACYRSSYGPGDMTSEGWNLVESNQCVISGDSATVTLGVDPSLSPLADNGGPTATHALPFGSAATDAGDPAGPSDGAGGVLRVDQRGRPRAADGNGDGIPRADLGAFEACEDAADSDGDGIGDACDACPSVADDGADADADGIADACDDGDTDGDGALDSADDCPATADATQVDSDGDGIGDACDACPSVADDGADADGDGIGDACDACPSAFELADMDHDGVPDACDDCADSDGDGFGDPGVPGSTCPDDNCLEVANPAQEDFDGDGLGDACDACPSAPELADMDHDGVPDACDDCADSDGDGFGDPGVPGSTCPDDNCLEVANPGQEDFDGDGLGDACDPCSVGPDSDGDGVVDGCDECPATPDPTQADGDADGVGDACDDCPDAADPAQADADADAIGDACDRCPLDASNGCRVDLLRCGLAASRSLTAIRTLLTAGRAPVLDPARDLRVADVGPLGQVVIAGDALAVGDGVPGVIVFYELTPAAGPIDIRKSGADVVVSGW